LRRDCCCSFCFLKQLGRDPGIGGIGDVCEYFRSVCREIP